MSSDSQNGDEDYMEDTEEIDPTVFRIWDPLHKPATLQYTTEQLHSERVVRRRPYQLISLSGCTAMIHEGDVDLDPEYQRGLSFTV
jgi:hypothetical protein